MIVTCSKCGEKLDLNEHLFKMNADGALIELLFAQMARIFRQEFKVVYATKGESDIDALRLLLQTYKDDDEKVSAAAIAEINETWSRYLRKSGSTGDVNDFVYTWLPEENGDSSRVIPFRPRS